MPPREPSELPRPALTIKNLKRITEHIQRIAFAELIRSTIIERALAHEACTTAANEFARVLTLTLSEHGATVEPWQGVKHGR